MAILVCCIFGTKAEHGSPKYTVVSQKKYECNFVLACLFDLGFRHEGSIYDHIVLTPKYIGKVWCCANSSHSQFVKRRPVVPWKGQRDLKLVLIRSYRLLV